MPLFRLPSRAKARSAAERGNSGRLAVPRCLTMPTCWLAYRSAWRAPFRGASAPAPLADSLHQPAALCRAGFQPARSLRVAALSIRLAVPTRGASCLTCGAGAFRPVRFLSTCRRPGAREGAAARPVERAACRTGASRSAPPAGRVPPKARFRIVGRGSGEFSNPARPAPARPSSPESGTGMRFSCIRVTNIAIGCHWQNR